MAQLSKPFPLSFAQQRLWLLDQLVPGIAFYHLPFAVRLLGRLVVPAFTATFEVILRRHGSLRTIFREENGQPFQYIIQPESFSLPLVDLSGLPSARREGSLLQLTGEEAQRSFDLSRGPLVRVILFRLGLEDHAATVTMHHIVSDGWSAGIFVRELSALYDAFVARRPSPLRELPIQYVDFAVWQRRRLQGEVLEAELAYWRQQLADLPPILSLPTDRPRPAVQRFRGETRNFVLSPPLSARLKALSMEQGTTLFVLLLAAFKVLLHRYSGQTDLAVGTPVANRTRVKIENLIGFFVNTLVLRSDLSGAPSFSDLLAQVMGAFVEAYGHQEVPFEMLVAELQPERSLSHTPLFQIMFVLQNAPMRTLQLADLRLQPIAVSNKTAKFDLTLIMVERDGRLMGGIEYSTDLFNAATIERMIGHLQGLLAGIAAAPESRISSLPLLTAGEQHQALVEWNDTDVGCRRDKLLHQLFEEQVKRSPEVVAVAAGEGTWTYEELNRRANRLARHLRSLGVRPDVPVAMFMERGFEMVMALIGILKAGGAYLGLDLSAPRDRLLYMLLDSDAPVVLTQERLLGRVPETAATVLCLDRDQDLLAGWSDEDLPAAGGLDNLHSVVYTSGSTGAPKGTLATASNYLNLCTWYLTFSRYSAETRSLLATGINFDSSFRIFSALLSGGRTVLADNEPYDAETLLATIRGQGVTVITCPPSLIHAVIDQAEESGYADLASMSYLHLGGEPIVSSKLRGWIRSENCRCTVTNVYGLTETSDVSVTGVVWPEDLEGSGSVPIGRPLQNHKAYVLNRHGQPQPIGIPGELCIGGMGCTRGFLNHPDLTAERFVPDPFAAGGRLYRTGDLARWRPDGRLEYDGRLDHQVKIRGFRVELGEIETVLAQTPGVREAVAVIYPAAAGGDKRIAAYLVAKPGEKPSLDGVREFLRSKMPEFMVPAALILLDELPLNASGKIDRQRLPEPEWGRARVTRHYIAPRSEGERLLAGLCAELLGLERIGIDDNFFEMGGHSLLAVQLLSRIRDAFGVQLPLRRLFQAPTVAELARVVGELASEAKTPAGPGIKEVARQDDFLDSVLVKIQPSGSRPPLFCVHPANGNVHHYLELAKCLGPEQPFYGLQSPDPEKLSRPLESIQEMASVYLQIVRAVQPAGPYHLAGWSMGGVVAVEMARQLQPEETLGLLALLDPSTPERFPRLQGEAKDNLLLLAQFARDLVNPADKLFHLPIEDLEALNPDEQLNYLLLKARIHKILPPDLDSAQVMQLFRSFKMNIQALQRYSALPFDGTATLFLPEQGEPERARSWRDRVAGPLDVRPIPGNHYSMLHTPNVEVLACELSQALASGKPRFGDLVPHAVVQDGHG